MIAKKPESTAEGGLLTGREAAQYLAISESLLWKMMDKGEIPCVRIGRSVRYHLPDLVNWIQARKSCQGRA